MRLFQNGNVYQILFGRGEGSFTLGTGPKTIATIPNPHRPNQSPFAFIGVSNGTWLCFDVDTASGNVRLFPMYATGNTTWSGRVRGYLTYIR